MKFRIARKLNYYKKARHRHGFGIHSPFLFHLITDVIENKKQLPAYKILHEQRKRLTIFIKDNKEDPGLQTYSDSILNSSGRKNLFKAVELSFRYGKLLVRLVNEFHPKIISCYGPTFGLNLLYLSLSNNSIPVYHLQSDDNFQRICKETLGYAGVENVKICDKEDPAEEFSGLVFVNFPFSPDKTEKIVKSQMDSNGENNVLIVRGIHESKPMEFIWKEFIKNDGVRVSLDLFEFGIVMFRKNLQKEHFILRF
jgi:hypothetical protein